MAAGSLWEQRDMVVHVAESRVEAEKGVEDCGLWQETVIMHLN